MIDSISVLHNSRLKTYRKNYLPGITFPHAWERENYCLCLYLSLMRVPYKC
nr:MAG TPA: hypothetical protein [Caudoviricetes sp.]